MEEYREYELNNFSDNFKKLIESRIGKIIRFQTIQTTYYPLDPINLKLEISDKNCNLLNTKYLNTSDNKFIHFTSLEALFSIINERSIRLYNMNISNDSEEYAYAFKIFEPLYNLKGVKEEDVKRTINFIKTNMFYLSLTNINNLNNNELWEKYGYKNKGVAIEFIIENDIFEWQNFYFSNVIYGDNPDFKEVKIEWENFKKRFPKDNIELDINPLLGLNKEIKWETENEIRLLFNHRSANSPIAMNNDIDNYIIDDFRTDKNRFDKDIKYFKLPLYSKQESPLLNKKFPLLKISNIYFGKYWDHISKYDTIEKIRNKIFFLILMKLGYKIHSIIHL